MSEQLDGVPTAEDPARGASGAAAGPLNQSCGRLRPVLLSQVLLSAPSPIRRAFILQHSGSEDQWLGRVDGVLSPLSPPAHPHSSIWVTGIFSASSKLMYKRSFKLYFPGGHQPSTPLIKLGAASPVREGQTSRAPGQGEGEQRGRTGGERTERLFSSLESCWADT